MSSTTQNTKPQAACISSAHLAHALQRELTPLTWHSAQQHSVTVACKLFGSTMYTGFKIVSMRTDKEVSITLVPANTTVDEEYHLYALDKKHIEWLKSMPSDD